MQFLSTKAFHPNTKRNRTAVYEAEKAAKELKAKEIERKQVLAREQDLFDRMGKSGAKASLAFMYSQPKVVGNEEELKKEYFKEHHQAKLEKNELARKKRGG